MTTYGKCLTTVLKAKKDCSPVFRRIFLNRGLKNFDFSELLKRDVNSWDFFIESLEFFKSFFIKVKNNYQNKFFTESVQDFVNILIEEFGNSLETFSDINYLHHLILFSKEIKEKRVQHYYIETENLFKFLTTINVKSQKDMLEFLKIQESKNVTFAFHFPQNSGVTINLKFENEKIITRFENSAGFFSIPDANEKILDFINKNKAIKLCFNAISYTSCFADHIIDGVPRDSKDKPIKSENPKTLKPVKEIENFTPKDIVAHFRHAHFRFCGSDYFKEKKGKWVFVKGSMVNTEAKTIVEDD